MVDYLEDPRRIDASTTAGERQMLEEWLDFHRVTLLLKCEGLTDEQRKRRPVESSLLSLHGLVRHMADVERGWFQRTLLERSLEQATPRFWTKDDHDADFTGVGAADWGADLEAWHDECAASRAAAATKQLDDVAPARPGDPRGEFSLRWILVHMVEEYARHNGHADLIRELIDGAVGD